MKVKSLKILSIFAILTLASCSFTNPGGSFPGGNPGGDPTNNPNDNSGGNSNNNSDSDNKETISVTGVSLSKANGSTFYVNKTGQLNAEVSPTNATNKSVIYQSSDNSVATVDENGKVSCLKEGEVTFTVTTVDGNFSDTIKISITSETIQNDENELTSGIIKRTIDDKEYKTLITCASGTPLSSKPFETTNKTITFNNVIQDSEYVFSGEFNGSIIVNVLESVNVTFSFSNFTLSSSDDCPLIVNTCNNFDLSAKSGTMNYVNDTRGLVEDESAIASAIYTDADLTLKGKGSLTVTSSNNKGIHSKDDLDVKNLTLKIDCKDNALKGNDGVTIESGTLDLIARQGDTIKTSNSSISSKGNQKGSINILDGTLNLYAACDGLDAAYDTNISGGIININTDSYSSYSETVTATSSSKNYLKVSSTSYKYSLKYYNSSSDYKWITPTSTVSSSGFDRSTYYTYDKPSGYQNVAIYVYTSTQSTGQDTNYTFTKSMTVNSSYDTISVSNSRGSWTTSWTNYTTQSGPGGGFGPGGGMNDGNQNKGDYSTKGIKSNNEINISGGTITIKSYDDSIHANNDETLENNQTAKGNINISGGNINLTSKDDALHADQDLTISGTSLLTVETSYEGLEADRIYIKGGYSHVYATDDAANASKGNGSYTPLFEMSDGYLELEVPSGDTDTLDSNGNVTLSGGMLIVKNGQSGATSQTGGTIDLDGTLSMTGGTLISVGTWCNEASVSCLITNTSSTLSAGTYYLKTSSGEEITSFTTKTSMKGYRIASKSLASGTYTLYNGTTSVCSFTK